MPKHCSEPEEFKQFELSSNLFELFFCNFNRFEQPLCLV